MQDLNTFDIFAATDAEFEMFLKQHTSEELAYAKKPILDMSKAVKDRSKLSDRDKLRIRMYVKACSHFLIAKFFGYTLPYALIVIFQAFLIIQKLFEMRPFGEMSWLGILSPIWVKIVFDMLVPKSKPSGSK